MKRNIAALTLFIVLAGCSVDQWQGLADNSERVQGVSQGVGVVAEKSAVITGPYGELVSVVALGVASVAAGIGAFARKKLKALEEAK